jgi:hypothetical protein
MPRLILLLVSIALFTGHLFANGMNESRGKFRMRNTISEFEAIEKTRKIITDLINIAFRELKDEQIEVKSFKSDSNYFKSRFSIRRFLTLRKITYLVYVNPQVFRKSAPVKGIEAIVAHELAHVLYYQRKNRFELVGLIGLLDHSFTTKFERKTDLEAIARGFGKGLIEFRNWLYKNVPDDDMKRKRRDYFSPDEIRLIIETLDNSPDKLEVWRKEIPLSLDDIKQIR